MKQIQERTLRKLRTIRKLIPTVFLLVYIVVWGMYVYATRDVASGNKIFPTEYLMNQSQLTAYMEYVWLGASIVLAWFMIRLACDPDGFMRYRVKVLEKEIADLKKQISERYDEGDSESPVGGPYTEKGIENP